MLGSESHLAPASRSHTSAGREMWDKQQSNERDVQAF